MGRLPGSRNCLRPHTSEVERAQSQKPLPALDRVHGGRELGRVDELARAAPCRGGGMSEPVNIRQIAPGTKIALVDGALAEVVSNPADGVWVFARYLSSPGDPSRVGGEEMIFAQDIVEIRED